MRPQSHYVAFVVDPWEFLSREGFGDWGEGEVELGDFAFLFPPFCLTQFGLDYISCSISRHSRAELTATCCPTRSVLVEIERTRSVLLES